MVANGKRIIDTDGLVPPGCGEPDSSTRHATTKTRPTAASDFHRAV
jgi:hypothetical protein